MSLTRGARLGPSEVVDPLGAGGRGAAYKAPDPRLDGIAINVLPGRVASDPKPKPRFEREAETISSLNHPHICTPRDGKQDAIDLLVMEHLEGETLRVGMKQEVPPC